MKVFLVRRLLYVATGGDKETDSFFGACMWACMRAWPGDHGVSNWFISLCYMPVCLKSTCMPHFKLTVTTQETEKPFSFK